MDPSGEGRGVSKLRSGLIDVAKLLSSMRTFSVSEDDRIGGHRLKLKQKRQQ